MPAELAMPDFETMLREFVRRVIREEMAARVEPAAAELLTTAEAAAAAKVKPGTIRRWVKQGRLRSHNAGRSVRVKRVELEKFLRSGGRPANDLTPEQLAARDFG